MTGTFVAKARRRWQIASVPLANRAGATSYDLARFEAGRFKPKTDRFRRALCEALRLTVIEAARETIQRLETAA